MFKSDPRRALTGIAGAVLVIALLMNIFQANRIQALQNQVNAAHHKAFFETLTLMDSMGANLEKLLIAGSHTMEQELLGSISRQADAAQDNLSSLPSSLPSISGSLKFVNQLGDFASATGKRLAGGGELTDDDRDLIATLKAGCSDLNGLLDEMVLNIRNGGDPFENAAESAPVILQANEENDPSVEFPSLLYDGPFSDGRPSGYAFTPEGEPVTQDQAIEQARRFLGEERVLSIRSTGEGMTPAACWEISAYVKEGELSMAVTQQGGHILYVICDEEPDDTRFSQAELIDLASAFLHSRGYPPCTVSYWSFDDNIMTVNFAAMQNGVILYPDLIKVQMDGSTGLIVGLEALNYLSNHRNRENLKPGLTEEAARALLNPLLSIRTGRLCVIPTDTGEALAWEFDGYAENIRYLVYIDAHTGDELEIFRVIEDENGQLAV